MDIAGEGADAVEDDEVDETDDIGFIAAGDFAEVVAGPVHKGWCGRPWARVRMGMSVEDWVGECNVRCEEA